MLRCGFPPHKACDFAEKKHTHFCFAAQQLDAIASPPKPVWRNWQTRTTQNRVPKRSVGSTPTTGTTLSIDRPCVYDEQLCGPATPRPPTRRSCDRGDCRRVGDLRSLLF